MARTQVITQSAVMGALLSGSGKVEYGRNRNITKWQAAAFSLSTSSIYTSSARTGNELHWPHMCFAQAKTCTTSINTRFAQARYEQSGVTTATWTSG